MEQFETVEGKILFLTYNLYKTNRICIQQKNEIKGKVQKSIKQDMLITKDNRLKKLMQELKIGHNISQIESSLENINDASPRDLDDSLSMSYKNKRPKRFQFLKSNFPKHLETRANDDGESSPRNSNQQFEFDTRRRVYSLAADSC